MVLGSVSASTAMVSVSVSASVSTAMVLVLVLVSTDTDTLPTPTPIAMPKLTPIPIPMLPNGHRHQTHGAIPIPILIPVPAPAPAPAPVPTPLPKLVAVPALVHGFVPGPVRVLVLSALSLCQPQHTARSVQIQCIQGEWDAFLLGGGGGYIVDTLFRERGNDTSRSTGRSGRQNAATRRNMRREERVTVQGPVKKQQNPTECHTGGYIVDTL